MDKQGTSSQRAGVTWYRPLRAGLLILAGLMLVGIIPWPEWMHLPDEVFYFAVLFGVVTAILLVALGALLGVAELVNRRRVKS